MSETSNQASLDQLKKTHEQLVFIHTILTQSTRYTLEEVDIAKDSARTITDMANKLADDIKARIDAETGTQASQEVVNE